jgi:hypothetical protein
MDLDNEMRNVLQSIINRAENALDTLDSRRANNRYQAVYNQLALIEEHVGEMNELLTATDGGYSDDGDYDSRSSRSSSGKWCKKGKVNSINEALSIPKMKRSSPWGR